MPSRPPLLYPAQTRLLETFGQRLREARLRRRLTASQVSERADISRATLVKVEQGDPAVTLGTYTRVMSVMGLEVDLAKLAADDPVGRRLQDAQLAVPRRAPRRAARLEPADPSASRRGS